MGRSVIACTISTPSGVLIEGGRELNYYAHDGKKKYYEAPLPVGQGKTDRLTSKKPSGLREKK